MTNKDLYYITLNYINYPDMDAKEQIIQLEEKFLEAMRTSNADELDALIADNLLFTAHDGAHYTKQTDINAHRAGDVKIYSLETSDQDIRIHDDVAIVSVLKNISGSYFGVLEVGIFRFTRVWKFTGGSWKVIAAHSTKVVH